MKDLRFALTAIVLALVAACPVLAQDDKVEFDPDKCIQQRPSGLFLKGSLMLVEQQESDVSGILGAYTVNFDQGRGGSFGVGWSFGSTPYTHALIVNGILDIDLSFAPPGFYVGGGGSLTGDNESINYEIGLRFYF